MFRISVNSWLIKREERILSGASQFCNQFHISQMDAPARRRGPAGFFKCLCDYGVLEGWWLSRGAVLWKSLGWSLLLCQGAPALDDEILTSPPPSPFLSSSVKQAFSFPLNILERPVNSALSKRWQHGAAVFLLQNQPWFWNLVPLLTSGYLAKLTHQHPSVTQC